MNQPFHSIRIRDLKFEVRLGWSAEERSTPQEIRISVELRFFNIPKGTISDLLEDTICYTHIRDAFKSYLDQKEFQLIERLASELDLLLKSLVQERAETSLIVHKVNPPLEDLLGGVEYRIGDFA